MLRRSLRSALAVYLAVAALGPWAAGCGEAMKTPTDPGLYRTRSDARPAAEAPLDRSRGGPEAPPLEVGQASWYGQALAGRRTASGERFDPGGYTAAHRTLKLGTWVEVRRVDTGTSVRVRINDRGPHVAGRIVDLSRRAAEDLDLVRVGVARVELRVVSGP